MKNLTNECNTNFQMSAYLMIVVAALVIALMFLSGSVHAIDYPLMTPNSIQEPTNEDIARAKARIELCNKYVSLKNQGEFEDALQVLKTIWPNTDTSLNELENSMQSGSDADIRNIEENTECTTIADNIVGSSETIPRDQILFPNLPTQSINLIFEPRLVEGASDLLRDDNQGNRIRPLMAIDANTLLLQAWDGSTGYIDELFLVDQDTTKSIYKRDFVYSSLYVHRPTHVDKQNRELTLVVSKEGTEEVFSYNLDTDKLQVIEERHDANELLEEEKSRYALRINADHIWEVFERSNPDVVLFKEIRSPSLLEAADGLLIRDANREKHFYWDGQSLYQFPREINGKLVLAIDLALDGTIYAYTRTGERETFGLPSLLETQQIWRYE